MKGQGAAGVVLRSAPLNSLCTVKTILHNAIIPMILLIGEKLPPMRTLCSYTDINGS